MVWFRQVHVSGPLPGPKLTQAYEAVGLKADGFINECAPPASARRRDGLQVFPNAVSGGANAAIILVSQAGLVANNETNCYLRYYCGLIPL